MLNKITPVLLTYNEAPNIERTLNQLTWATDIVVVDSFSDDETLSILATFKQVRVFQRKFDFHANQWNYAIRETDINSEWILALDADYVLTSGSIEELTNLKTEAKVTGYRANFTYCIFGHPLRGSLYPPVTVLYRKKGANYYQDGHTQRLMIPGKIMDLNSPILHDDHKSLKQWLISQDRYMKLEAGKLLQLHFSNSQRSDFIRKLKFVAPLVIFLYCLIAKGLILDGWAGIYYALQRTLAEILLSLHLIRHDLERSVAFYDTNKRS